MTGGFALAAQWAGFKTVAFVEIEPYAQAILKQNFGAVADAEQSTEPTANNGRSKYSGERSTVGSFNSSGCTRPRLFSDIFAFDGTAYRGATLLTGGFPCQPFSQAGKRRGKEDDRFLWPEMLRVIHEARPTWVLGENVAGIVNMELDRCISDLEGEGYAVQALIIPACAVDAKHRRDRVWILGSDTQRDTKQFTEQRKHERASDITRCNVDGLATREAVAHAAQVRYGQEHQDSRRPRQGAITPEERRGFADGCRWLPEPEFCGVVNELPKGLDEVGGGINADSIMGIASDYQETPQGFLYAVWLVTVDRLASQGPRSNEQLSGEFRDTLRFMPYQGALGEWETAVASSQSYMHGLWKACEAIGALRNSSDSLFTVWQSLPSEEAIWAGMAAYHGPFFSEWPNIPRVATGVKNRVDRLKGLGNAIVPQVAYQIIQEIADQELARSETA